MYHTLKNKKVKPPKGWRFSGDPSFLNFFNSDFNIYFMVVNRRVRGAVQTGYLLPKDKNEWELEEHHGQTGVKIKIGQNLTNREAKQIAMKLAKDLNKKSLCVNLL